MPLESLLFLEYRVSPLSSSSLFVEGNAHFPTAMFAGLYVNRWRDGTGERVVEGRDNFNLWELRCSTKFPWVVKKWASHVTERARNFNKHQTFVHGTRHVGGSINVLRISVARPPHLAPEIPATI